MVAMDQEYRHVSGRLDAGDIILSASSDRPSHTLGMIVASTGSFAGEAFIHPRVITPELVVRPLAEYCRELGIDKVRIIKPSAITDSALGSGTSGPTTMWMKCKEHGNREPCSLCA